MSLLELCDREIAAVPLDATVADAINKMLDHHVGAVAVVDSEYRVAGIFTEQAMCSRKNGHDAYRSQDNSSAGTDDDSRRDGHAAHRSRRSSHNHAGASLPPSAGCR